MRRSFSPPIFLVCGLLCLAGIILSTSEPAAFLDQQAALLLLRIMPAQNRSQVCKVVMPRERSEQDLAQRIVCLKSAGVRGILLNVSPTGMKMETALGHALAMEGVVWITHPTNIAPALARRATCHPLLVCAEFGSAVLAEQDTNQPCSATALALACSGDMKSVKRLGCNAFKMLFRNKPYPGPGDTNIVLACITQDDAREPQKYSTPAGQKTSSDYALDICQALLDQRWLVQMQPQDKCLLIVVVTLIFVWVGKAIPRLMVLLALLAVLSAIALSWKIHLPVATVVLLYLFVSALSPIFRPEPYERIAS